MPPSALTARTDTIFRPVFPDEIGRARLVDGNQDWGFPSSEWFVALLDEPMERIIGVIRHCRSSSDSKVGAFIDFRMTLGHGAELHDQQENFIQAFIKFIGPNFVGILRNTISLEVGHFLEPTMKNLGFTPTYRELILEAPTDKGSAKVLRAHSLFQKRRSPMNRAVPIPLRNCAPEAAIPLLTSHGLMSEREIRALWLTPDRSLLDRDASACLMLDGETLGVLLCANAGDTIRIIAVAGQKTIAGARSRTITGLLHHILQVSAHRNYQHVIFRANAEMAKQTHNLALRTGGTVVRETCRWVKEIR